ncbi:hypothetical protein C0991_007486, partial [Blastosporella zonata]
EMTRESPSILEDLNTMKESSQPKPGKQRRLEESMTLSLPQSEMSSNKRSRLFEEVRNPKGTLFERLSKSSTPLVSRNLLKTSPSKTGSEGRLKPSLTSSSELSEGIHLLQGTDRRRLSLLERIQSPPALPLVGEEDSTPRPLILGEMNWRESLEYETPVLKTRKRRNSLLMLF